MKTIAQLESAIASVDPVAIGRAHLIICSTGNFYKVQSSRDETVEYTVKHDRVKGFSCTCPAGEQAFSRCKIGVCAHVLIALAAKREEVEAVGELNRLIAEQTIEAQVQKAMSDPATIAQAEQAKEAPVQAPRKRREAAPYQPRAFSILR